MMEAQKRSYLNALGLPSHFNIAFGTADVTHPCEIFRGQPSSVSFLTHWQDVDVYLISNDAKLWRCVRPVMHSDDAGHIFPHDIAFEICSA